MNEHVEELAELYALGSLDDLERKRVQRHVASCTPCAERVALAEETVAHVAESQPRHAAPEHLHARLRTSIGKHRARAYGRTSIAAAIAAAVVLALIPTWVAVDRTRHFQIAMNQDEHALARLASEQFDRAQFMSMQHRPMDAKVLYGPHGDWYYVVVMHPHAGMRVAYMHAGHMEMLGSVAMHGESGTLYLPINHKMEELALLQGDTVVADAHLLY